MRIPVLRLYACLLCLLLTSPYLSATHIVGAELFYTCINPSAGQYRITLKMYRDCLTGQATFDDPITLFFFDGTTGATLFTTDVAVPAFTPRIPPNGLDSCAASPYELCVEEAVYETVIDLPPRAGGYDIGWARCCRNGTVTNLWTPLDQGVTFLAHIPGFTVADHNSMPVFNLRPPIFICASETLYFDHSATDPDGDSLVYQLTNPYTGINTVGIGAGTNSGASPPPVVNASNPMGPPPYLNVNFNAGYNHLTPFGSTALMAINPGTGRVTFAPDMVGVYVVAVSVFEYRDGILLSENKRDFQIHAVSCLPVGDPPVIGHDLTGLPVSGDTVLIDANVNFCYEVTISDPDPFDIVVGDLISSGGAGISVTLAGTNPVVATVCWTPGCSDAGGIFPLILSGRDPTDCPVYNIVYDTVWVKVYWPEGSPPEVGYDVGATMHDGDTILITAGQNGCFTWFVRDTAAATLSQSVMVSPVGAGSGFVPTTTVVDFGDSLALTTCWTGLCDQIGQLFLIELTGRNVLLCPPEYERKDSLYLRILPAPNPVPVIEHNLSGTVFSSDTVFIQVHDTACFEVILEDTAATGVLSASIRTERIGAGGTGMAPVLSVTTLGNILTGTICWIPSCEAANGLFRLITTGTQLNACAQFQEVADTVWVHIAPDIQVPPAVGYNWYPGLVTSGDTLFLLADTTGCATFSATDTSGRGFVLADVQVTTLSGGPVPFGLLTVDTTAATAVSVMGNICISPGCQLQNEILQIVISARDTFDCPGLATDADTFYVLVIVPESHPPVLNMNTGSLTFLDGNFVFTPGVQACYTVMISDPDSAQAQLTANGISEIFTSGFGDGNNPATVSVSGTNPLTVEVCWTPSCYDQGKTLDFILCGKDEAHCGVEPQVCDTLRVAVSGCAFTMPNVFTPNADGIHDSFEPYGLQGVTRYTLTITDRWGVLFYQGNGPWDGNRNGGTPGSEGVYYWTVEYEYFAANGVPILSRMHGNVTLLR